MELDRITSFDNYAVLFSPVAFVRSVLFFGFFWFFFEGGGGGGGDLSRGGAKNENNKKKPLQPRLPATMFRQGMFIHSKHLGYKYYNRGTF